MKKLTIDSKFVGIPWKRTEREITWRDSTNYAAVLQDMLPCYFDDVNNSSLMIHPMFFVVNAGWPLIYNMGDYIDIPDARELIGQLVHYKTNIKYAKPAYTPLKITINGKIAQMKPHKRGTEIAFGFDFIDETGELVCTEYMICMLREVECVGTEKTLPGFPAEKSCPALPPVFTKEIVIDPAFPYLYDACSGAFNPIHTSHAFAKSVGLPDMVVAGVSTLALGVKEVISHALSGNFSLVDSIYARLSGMVFQNDILEIRIIEQKKEGKFLEIFFEIYNKTTGKKAVSDGYIKIR